MADQFGSKLAAEVKTDWSEGIRHARGSSFLRIVCPGWRRRGRRLSRFLCSQREKCRNC